MNVRLVAYRRQDTSVSEDTLTQFELDLKDNPNIVAKYNWIDIKEPDKRKASFSQTIKLPFSNRNNKFFESWYDVNLDTLVFNTSVKFRAIIYVDSIPQLKGFLQLKKMYLNARYYECALFGQTADFFTDIKDKKLKDAFKKEQSVTDAGVVSTILVDDKQLDHLLTPQNVVKSWTTGVATTDDPSTNDNDIMYPIIDYGHNPNPLSTSMLFSPDEIVSLADEFDGSYTDALQYYGMITPSILKPAIRIQRLLKILAQKSGYSIKSTFLGIAEDGTQSDTNWFSRLFMTLAPQHTRVQTLANSSEGLQEPFVGFKATGFTSGTSPAVTIPCYGDYFTQCYTNLATDTEVYDPNNLYFNTFQQAPYEILVSGVGTAPTVILPMNGDSVATNYGNMQIQTDFQILLSNTTTSGVNLNSVDVVVNWWRMDSYIPSLQDSMSINCACDGNVHTLSFTNQLGIFAGYGYFMTINFYNFDGDSDLTGLSHTTALNQLTIQSVASEDFGLFNGIEGGEVSMYYNMPDISQADFVKDLINRFNLIIKTDPENEKLLLIEPYQDFIDAGETKYWTDKLDVSKEQVVMSTNEIQSKELHFSDLDDNDFLNKRYKDLYDVTYGKYREIKKNDFAKKEFKNFSVMSPYIAQGLPNYDNGNIGGAMEGQDIVIGHLYEAPLNEERKVTASLKPKIFYYSGTPNSIDLDASNQNKFHIYNSSYIYTGDSYPSDDTGGGAQTKFPLCSQYALDNFSTGVTNTTKITHFTYYSPNFISNLTYNYFGTTVSSKGLYQLYWSQYFNEIYSEEARIMECYVNLSPEDINTFEGTGFQNTYFIKNTLWRVLSVDNYLVGGNKSTKVKLLKVIQKLPDGCGLQPTVGDSGLITYTDSVTGASVTDITNECCTELNPSWTFVEQNSTTGVGDCYSLEANFGNDVVGDPFNPYGDDDDVNVSEGVNSGFSDAFLPSLMPNIQNNFAIARRRQTASLTKNIVFFADCITNDNSTAVRFNQQQVASKMFRLAHFTMAYVNVVLIGTVNTGTNIGKVGQYEYDIVLVNRGGFPTQVGTTTGDLAKQQKDSAFTNPVCALNTYDSEGYFKPTVTGGANEQVSWVAKFSIFTQPVGNAISQVGTGALFQNGSRITHQNSNFLVWD